MSGGSCRSEGCEKPRRVRRGLVEWLCEDCYRRAMRRVADQLAGEETASRKARVSAARGGVKRKAPR